jgi:hypothetical protein
MAALDTLDEERMERLLRVATCLAECGYGTQVGQLAATARAFRGDAQLWTAQAQCVAGGLGVLRCYGCKGFGVSVV